MKPILEHIPLGRQQSVYAFRYASEYFDMPWHFHPQHELTYIEESKGSVFIGDYVGAYEAGELTLLRANLPHCWKNYAKDRAMAVSTVVQWNKGIYAKVPELMPVYEMLKAASRGIQFTRESVEHLIPDILKLPARRGQEQYVELLNILLQLSTCSWKSLSTSGFTDDLPTTYNSRMAKIHAFVEANYHRRIYLHQLAELVNMSESSFSRFFSHMMSRPFFTFLNEYRINMASRLLIDTDWSVAEIGYACGYESLPFYHKQFKKFKEMPPSKFRKKYALSPNKLHTPA